MSAENSPKPHHYPGQSPTCSDATVIAEFLEANLEVDRGNQKLCVYILPRFPNRQLGVHPNLLIE